jgi:hypothetical protein
MLGGLACGVAGVVVLGTAQTTRQHQDEHARSARGLHVGRGDRGLVWCGGAAVSMRHHQHLQRPHERRLHPPVLRAARSHATAGIAAGAASASAKPATGHYPDLDAARAA